MNSLLGLMAFGVLLSSFSQVLLKKSANKHMSKGFLKQYMNPYVIIGYGLLLIALMIPLYAFTVVPFKYAAIIESLGYFFVMILSRIFFGEKITKNKIIGNGLIIMGVIIFGLNIV